MAGITPGTEAAALLPETWNPEFGLDPFEEDVVSGLIAEPVGARSFGGKLHLRKIKAMTANTLGPTTLGLKSDLTFNVNTEVEVQVTPLYAYSGVQYAPHTLTRLIDDGPFRAGQRKMLKAALGVKRATDILTLAGSASQIINQANINEDQLVEGIGRMAEYAMNKFKLGETPLNIVVHPKQVKNYLKIGSVREYQIRGSEGSAATGRAVNTYNITCRESGLVYVAGGVAFQPMLLKDAWAIGHNQPAMIMAPEVDGVSTTVVAVEEYGVAEWFDSSVIVLSNTV